MSDIGLDGIIGAFASMALLALAFVWATVAAAIGAFRTARGRPVRAATQFIGAAILGAVGATAFLLVTLDARNAGDWVGGIGIFAAPLLAIIATFMSRK